MRRLTAPLKRLQAQITFSRARLVQHQPEVVLKGYRCVNPCRGYLAHPRSIQLKIRLQFTRVFEVNTCPQRELSMILQILYQALTQCFLRIGKHLEQRFKRWSQPIHAGLLPGTISDLTRSKSELILENAFLRQQLIVLHRQTKRPILTGRDRGLLVLLSSRLRTWHEALLIVKPDTLLR